MVLKNLSDTWKVTQRSLIMDWRQGAIPVIKIDLQYISDYTEWLFIHCEHSIRSLNSPECWVGLEYHCQ